MAYYNPPTEKQLTAIRNMGKGFNIYYNDDVETREQASDEITRLQDEIYNIKLYSGTVTYKDHTAHWDRQEERERKEKEAYAVYVYDNELKKLVPTIHNY
mgnify:FL=1|jgi:hypothetical protein